MDNTNEFKPSGLDASTLKFLSSKSCLPVSSYQPVPRISTGSLAWDYALGGGIPRGSMSTLTGDPGFGKTTLSILAGINTNAADPSTMKNKGLVAFFDSEHTYDPSWALKLGADPTRLHLYQPDSGEALQDIVFHMLDNAVYDLIVIDSISETVFNAELAGSAEDSHVGVAARKWSAFWRKSIPALKKSGTSIICINRLTYGIGKFNPTGQPTEEYGGRSMQGVATIRMHLTRPEASKSGDTKTFNLTTRKNKTATWPRKASIELVTSAGRPFINPMGEIMELGKILRVFTNKEGGSVSGGYWFYKDTQLGVGAPATRLIIAQDEELREDILESIRSAMASSLDATPEPAEVEVEEGVGSDDV